MTRYSIAPSVAFALAFFANAPAVTAQTIDAQPIESSAPSPGWTMTPTLVFATSHDSNVLVHEKADNPPADVVNVINPRGTLDFRGRRTQFSGTYNGAVVLYHNFGPLDSYDQSGAARFTHQLTRRVSLFANDTVAIAPTTEILQDVAVPYIRTGASINDLSGGVEAAFSKRTTMHAAAEFQWVRFDEARVVDLVLRGGHSQGGSLALRHLLSARTAVTGDYNVHHAVVADGQANFDVQNGSIGLERSLSENIRVFAAGGVSHLGLSTLGPARTGASYRAGMTTRLHGAGVDLSYTRAFVPSFGFGGTMQNEDLTAQVRLALSRRAYTQGSLSWRRNDPLTLGEPSLHSRWTQVVAGYSVQPWLRVEGFYGAMSQSINRPGGLLDRTRLGFQIVTTQPMRVP